MKLKDLARETGQSLTANKARSSLTILGIVVGITSVIVMVAIGQGTKASVESSIASMGSNLLMVSGSSSSARAVGGGGMGASTASLTMADAAALKSQVAGIAAISPVNSGSYTVSAETSNTSVTVMGTNTDYPTVKSVSVERGSWFTAPQESEASRVAVLGPTTAETLFGTAADAVGKQVRISGQPFTVIGVTVAKGSNGMSNSDAIVYVPLASMTRFMSGGDTVSTIYVGAKTQDGMADVKASMTDLLLVRHGITDSTKADFQIQSQEDLATTMSTVTNMLTILLGSIAGISLLVGGIGIMNMMLTSVTERIREIGLRMAVGATRFDLTSQFLAEAVALTMLGGVIGIVLGWGIAEGVALLSSFKPVVSGYSVALAVGVSTLIGILFGFYPARRAARLDPIEALRYQ